MTALNRLRMRVQVRDCFSKVDGVRMVAKRPPPSYMRMGASRDSAGGLPVEDVPSLDEMQLYDSSELQLPEVPKEDTAIRGLAPHQAFNWSALQEDNVPVS